VTVRVVVVEWDDASARWVVREYGMAGVFYDGEGYVIGGHGFNLDAVGGAEAAEAAVAEGRRLAAWLNERAALPGEEGTK
jgi:hypothetical protein